MSKTKQATVDIEGGEGHRERTTGLEDLPPPERRRALAELYCELASDLYNWKLRHDVDAVESENDARLVWKVHKIVKQLDGKAIDLGQAVAQINAALEVLGKNSAGDPHAFKEGEVERLVELMCNSANADLAPYEPPHGWLRGW